METRAVSTPVLKASAAPLRTDVGDGPRGEECPTAIGE